MPLVIRTMQEGDDLAPFFGVEQMGLRWNPAQVYVAEAAGQLVACALVFDGGHDVVVLDYIRALPPWEGKGLWLRLARHVERALVAQGKKVLMGYVYPHQVMAMARLGGAVIAPNTYALCTKVLHHGS